jgi:cellobiose epimerase
MRIGRLLLVAAAFAAAIGATDEGEGSEVNPPNTASNALDLRSEMEDLLMTHILGVWYPKMIDFSEGGYFTDADAQWTLGDAQDKFLVTQARHMWALSTAGLFYRDIPDFARWAEHGYVFIRDNFWDDEHGGFFTMRSRAGEFTERDGYRDEKRLEANAQAIFALARYYELSEDPEVLETAKKAFTWIEDHAYDPVNKGYYPHLTREGVRLDSGDVSDAPDRVEFGLKSANSTLHLLEAYTALYRVWRDPFLKMRTKEALLLLRDEMIDAPGRVVPFFEEDWEQVDRMRAAALSPTNPERLRHVSFGHDLEVARLMLEAIDALEWDDEREETELIAKRLVDHALDNGVDPTNGGFYEMGAYLGKDISILDSRKSWWAQAEALNTLFYFDDEFGGGRYEEGFNQTWSYITTYLTDERYYGFYQYGLDTAPEARTKSKANMWKASYHATRAIVNCIIIMDD